MTPVPPVRRSEAFGYWEPVKGRTYRFAFRLFRFDLAGNWIGSQIVRHTVELARDGQSYTSQGAPEFYDVNGVRVDAAGNPLPTPVPAPTACSATTATRFK